MIKLKLGITFPECNNWIFNSHDKEGFYENVWKIYISGLKIIPSWQKIMNRVLLILTKDGITYKIRLKGFLI